MDVLIVWKTPAGNPVNLRDQLLDKRFLLINILSSYFCVEFKLKVFLWIFLDAKVWHFFRRYRGINYKRLLSTIQACTFLALNISLVQVFTVLLASFLEKGRLILHALLIKTYTGKVSTNFNTRNYGLFKISTSDYS